MKILLINKFHYRRGGAETYYFDLAEVLEKNGHEVHFFSMDDNQNVLCNDSKFFVKHREYVHANSLWQKFRGFCATVYSVEARNQLQALIREVEPDLIHINNYHRQLSCSIFDAARRCHIPVVMTAHDATSICPQIYMRYGETCTQCSGGKYYHCLQRRCIKGSLAMSFAGMLEGYLSKFKHLYSKIDTLIVPSHYIADIYRKDGFDPKKIIECHNAKQLTIQKPLQWPHRNYAIYFGRLSREKGILTLLEAVRNTDCLPIYIAGTGPEQENLENYIKTYHLEDRVALLEYKSGKELQDLIYNAKFSILPSETPENCPYSIIESLACGVPVLSSNLGGAPELLAANETGWIFKAGNVQDLSEHLIYAESCAEKLYDRCYQAASENYSMDSYYQKIIEIYEETRRKYGEN